MPILREQLVEVLGNVRGFGADHRAAILEDAMRHVAREEIAKWDESVKHPEEAHDDHEGEEGEA